VGDQDHLSRAEHVDQRADVGGTALVGKITVFRLRRFAVAAQVERGGASTRRDVRDGVTPMLAAAEVRMHENHRRRGAGATIVGGELALRSTDDHVGHVTLPDLGIGVQCNRVARGKREPQRLVEQLV
jgi:hypothetical protein